MKERTHDENMRLLAAVAAELRARGMTEVEPISDMGGEYIEFTYAGRTWAAAYGENCQLTGNTDRDVWGANTYDDAEPFLAAYSPVTADADDAELIAIAILGAAMLAS